MNQRRRTCLHPYWCLLAVLALLAPAPVLAAEKGSGETMPVGEVSADDVAAMMKKARALTTPGPQHEHLKRYLGTWDTETRITMPGGSSEPEKGVLTWSWLMEGRWLQSRGQGTMMGMPYESFALLGYDNFKKSFVTASVTSMDTALWYGEGDLGPSGDVLILWGTLDEYLTGEHDKMVKYLWRWISDDELVLEVHDMPIGEKNTKVVEVRCTRREKGD